MPRIPRKFILQNNSYFHVTWKCHNNDFLLRDEQVKARLYHLLRKYKQKYRVRIHGYCFMDNHPHLVGHCESVEAFSRFFQVVNGLLARYINSLCQRKGQVVMDRMRSPQIQDSVHIMRVLRYIDLNPVRAGIVKRPCDYKWSSHRYHSEGRKDPLVDPLPASLKISGLNSLSHSQCFAICQNDSALTRVPLFTRTFFIGTPVWIAKKKRMLYEALLESRSNRCVASE